MSKKLISFRLEEDRIEELRELANVYTNGNATDLVEFLIRRMYYLEPLALRGKYREKGFGVAGKDRERIKSAWDTWLNSVYIQNKPEEPKANTSIKIEINGDITALRKSDIRELAHILRIPIDTRCVYTVSVKKARGE